MHFSTVFYNLSDPFLDYDFAGQKPEVTVRPTKGEYS